MTPFDIAEDRHFSTKRLCYFNSSYLIERLASSLVVSYNQVPHGWIPNYLASETFGFSPLRARGLAHHSVHHIFADFGLKESTVQRSAWKKPRFCPPKLRSRQSARRPGKICYRNHLHWRLTLSLAQNTWGPCENFYLAPYPSLELRLRITDSGLWY